MIKPLRQCNTQFRNSNFRCLRNDKTTYNSVSTVKSGSNNPMTLSNLLSDDWTGNPRSDHPKYFGSEICHNRPNFDHHGFFKLHLGALIELKPQFGGCLGKFQGQNTLKAAPKIWFCTSDPGFLSNDGLVGRLDSEQICKLTKLKWAYIIIISRP